MHSGYNKADRQSYQLWKMPCACLAQHLRLQLQLKGTSCAAVSGLLAGVKSKQGSLGETAPHLVLCAAFGLCDASGIPSQKGLRGKGVAQPCR